MNINFQILYRNEEGKPVCFRHASQRAVLQNESIELEIDDFDSEYYLGSTSCVDCDNEL